MEFDALGTIEYAFNNAVSNAKLEIKNFGLLYDLDILLKDSVPLAIRKDLISMHSIIISEMQELGFLDYCKDVKNDDMLFSMFQSNCMEAESIQDEAELLQKCYTLRGKMAHIEDCIYDIDANFKQQSANSILEESEFIHLCKLLDNLPPDNEQHAIFFNRLKTIDFQFSNSLLPLNDMFISILQAFKDYFKVRLANLSEKLRNQPRIESFLFIENKVNEIKQQEILLSIDNEQLPKWSALLKTFLELESEYLQTIEKLKSGNNVIPKTISDNSSSQTISLYDTLYSFYYKNYNSNQVAITDLFNFLKKHNFVHEDTSLSDFRKIFTNNKPEKPIIWIGNISELSYFVKYLHNETKYIDNLKHNIWKITANIFVDANNKPFVKSKFRGQKTPARAELIERAINLLK